MHGNLVFEARRPLLRLARCFDHKAPPLRRLSESSGRPGISQLSDALKQAIQGIHDDAGLFLETEDFLAHQATRHRGQELGGHEIGSAVNFECGVENFRRLWRGIEGQQWDHDAGVEVVQQVRLDVQQAATSLGIDVDMKPRHVQKLRY